MADLNVRDFPEELMRELKARAARDGLTLKDLVVRELSRGFESFAAVAEMDKRLPRKQEDEGSGHSGSSSSVESAKSDVARPVPGTHEYRVYREFMLKNNRVPTKDEIQKALEDESYGV